jgi:hypothetical protein
MEIHGRLVMKPMHVVSGPEIFGGTPLSSTRVDAWRRCSIQAECLDPASGIDACWRAQCADRSESTGSS